MGELFIFLARFHYYFLFITLICGYQRGYNSLFPVNMAALLVNDTPQQHLASVFSQLNQSITL